MNRRAFPFLIALFTAVSVQALTPRGGPAPWSPGPVSADASDEVREIVQQADALYGTRQNPGVMDSIMATLRPAAEKFPKSYDVQWRLARACFWLGEVTKADGEHEKVAQEGYDAAQRALALKPNGPEALYFGSINVGEISHAVGVLTALGRGLESKFRDPLLAMEKIEPGIDNGGVYNALGRYKFELPWPMRDLDASEKYLKQALTLVPFDLRARVYLAETLAKRDRSGDADEGKRLLREVLEAKPGTYDTAEELRVQGFARALAARLKWSVQ